MARTNELILVANPGSSSRKYALYESASLKVRAELHVESVDSTVVATITQGTDSHWVSCDIDTIADAANVVSDIFEKAGCIKSNETITTIGLRIVAPSAFFMQHHEINDEVVARLESLEDIAPIHIVATLDELKKLRGHFTDTPIVGVSDSAFHHTKPNYTWNYGINIHDADRLDIKRFGYHGLSAQACVDELWKRGKLPPKVIVCHLGSGSSVSAIFHGRSIDTTMGFSPNEGVVMATRSGTISLDAARTLQQKLHLDDAGLDHYLNQNAGLLGLGQSNDIRELLRREAAGDHLAHLALATLVHTIHKSIGSMMVAMNGCDMIVFTGTVGERSDILRKRIVAHLAFADFHLDGTRNADCTEPHEYTLISQSATSRPIAVIPTNESFEIAKHTMKTLHSSPVLQ